MFYDSIKTSAIYLGINHLNIDRTSTDDVIGIDTQLGVKFDDIYFNIIDYVEFKRASIIFNTNNNTNTLNSFHCNTLWQLTTQQKICEYLSF